MTDTCPKCGAEILHTLLDRVGWGCENLDCDWRMTMGDLRRQLEQAQAENERLKQVAEKARRALYDCFNVMTPKQVAQQASINWSIGSIIQEIQAIQAAEEAKEKTDGV